MNGPDELPTGDRAGNVPSESPEEPKAPTGRSEGMGSVVDLDAGATEIEDELEFDLRAYDPDPVRDRLRGLLALLLLAHVAVVVAVSLFLLWAKPWHWDKLKDFLSVVFAPLLTLLGTVIGYYFGVASATARRNQT